MQYIYIYIYHLVPFSAWSPITLQLCPRFQPSDGSLPQAEIKLQLDQCPSIQHIHLVICFLMPVVEINQETEVAMPLHFQSIKLVQLSLSPGGIKMNTDKCLKKNTSQVFFYSVSHLHIWQMLLIIKYMSSVGVEYLEQFVAHSEQSGFFFYYLGNITCNQTGHIR